MGQNYKHTSLLQAHHQAKDNWQHSYTQEPHSNTLEQCQSNLDFPTQSIPIGEGSHTLQTVLEFTRFSHKGHNFDLFISKNSQSGFTTQTAISKRQHTLMDNFDHQALLNNNFISFKPSQVSYLQPKISHHIH